MTSAYMGGGNEVTRVHIDYRDFGSVKGVGRATPIGSPFPAEKCACKCTQACLIEEASTFFGQSACGYLE